MQGSPIPPRPRSEVCARTGATPAAIPSLARWGWLRSGNDAGSLPAPAGSRATLQSLQNPIGFVSRGRGRGKPGCAPAGRPRRVSPRVAENVELGETARSRMAADRLRTQATLRNRPRITSRLRTCVPLALPVRNMRGTRTGRASGTQASRKGGQEVGPGLFLSRGGSAARGNEAPGHAERAREAVSGRFPGRVGTEGPRA